MQYRELHPWNVSFQEAAEIQRDLRRMVSLVDAFGPIKLIAGVDVSVPSGSSVGRSAVAILAYPGLELVEARHAVRELTWPYIPGFLSFREIPVILAAIEQVEREPDIILVDGQGIAHPRGLGIAAHLGVLLDAPTIGCAKSRLYGTYQEPGDDRGDVAPLLGRGGDQVGNVLRTRAGARPVFVSPGNKVSFRSSVEIALDTSPKYRLPEPIRAAHRLAGEPAPSHV